MTQRAFYSNTAEEIALLDASIRGDLPTVRRHLAQGLDANTPDMREDPWNVTPLMHAAANGQEQVVKELLSGKAKVNLVDKSFPGEGGGETALHYSAANGHVGVAKLLLEAKASIDKLSRFGRTPLTVAVLGRQNEMARFLLENKADPNLARERTGLTPLHAAAYEGSVELARLLIKFGACVNPKYNGLETPFMVGALSPHTGVALFLAESGVDLNAAEWDGTTCLMRSVIGRNSQLVAEVLKRGGNVNALDNEGQSALDFAIRDKLTEIEALLRKVGAKPGAELRPLKKTSVSKRR